MAVFFLTIVGIACGLVILAVVVLFSLRVRTSKKVLPNSADHHDVFDKDPSLYSSYDPPDS